MQILGHIRRDDWHNAWLVNRPKSILKRLLEWQWPQRERKREKTTTSNFSPHDHCNKNRSMVLGWGSEVDVLDETKNAGKRGKNKIQSVAKSISLYVAYRLLCPLLDAETSWSSWRTCVQSDGNLCRCRIRRCQDEGNTPCVTDVEVRLENCTGNYENLISSLAV